MSDTHVCSPEDCQQVEAWLDEAHDELNAVHVWLAEQGYAVDAERPLLHDVRAALRGGSE